MGKSHLLPDNSSATIDRKKPTSGYQFVNASFCISLDPEHPTEGSLKETNITAWEIGTAGRARDNQNNAASFIRTDAKSMYDVVVLVFDGTQKTTYQKMWQTWAPLIPLLVASSYAVPFVVVAETHADKLSPGTLKRHRRAVEIDLYLAFEGRFIYRQLNATDANARKALWDQVAIQLRCQPQAERGKILLTRYPSREDNEENAIAEWFEDFTQRARSLWLRLFGDRQDAFIDLDEGQFELI